VQSAQGYENATDSWITRAAAQQEMMLYDAVLQGRGALGRAPCCGTNFVMRTEALRSVGGWDEHTVSEDQVTSFHLHRHGWRSAYHRELLALGVGPSDLPSYWKQQYRWAHGATRMARLVVTTPAPIAVKVETLWSSAFYALAILLGVLGTLPIVMTLVGLALPAPPSSWLTLSVYPLYLLVMLFPYLHMRLRGYPLRNLVLVQGLLAISIPLYLKAVVHGLVGGALRFDPSPKGTTPAWWSAPQVWAFAALLVMGPVLARLAIEDPHATSTWVLLAWTVFYTVSLGHYFLFVTHGAWRVARAEKR
ncbi:MAG: glycosyltransferase, partial [Deltaproteobacteria bacterium]|nr:glycosyltransferase [Deltaproteobacteria bacterium]